MSDYFTEYQCPPGYACPAGSAEPVICSPGSFQALSGQSVCDSCPPGKLSVQMRLSALNLYIVVFLFVFFFILSLFIFQVFTAWKALLYLLHVRWVMSVD